MISLFAITIIILMVIYVTMWDTIGCMCRTIRAHASALNASRNAMIRVTGKSTLGCIFVAMKTIAHGFSIVMWQWCNRSVRSLGNGTYEISYVVDGKLYMITTRKMRGPGPILLAMDQDSNCITDVLEQHLGPARNWHGQKYTPRMLGHRTIDIELANCTSLSFNHDDIIKIE